MVLETPSFRLFLQGAQYILEIRVWTLYMLATQFDKNEIDALLRCDSRTHPIPPGIWGRKDIPGD